MTGVLSGGDRTVTHIALTPQAVPKSAFDMRNQIQHDHLDPAGELLYGGWPETYRGLVGVHEDMHLLRNPTLGPTRPGHTHDFGDGIR